jgi:hypothetical protein
MNKLLVLLAGVLLSTSSFAMSGSYGISVKVGMQAFGIQLSN